MKGLPRNYRCEAESVDGFLAQLVRLISSGHYFYVTATVPEHKDPRAIDEKLLGLYDVDRPRWKRQRRNLKTSAGIHYLRHGRFFVLMLTKGNHAAFYRDHGEQLRDIRRTALKFAGYSIRYTFSEDEQRQRVFVRLDKETCRSVKAHLLQLATEPRYRQASLLEEAIHSLPYQPYRPVREQLYSIAKAVNCQRRRAGLPPVRYSCIREKRRLRPTFWVQR